MSNFGQNSGNIEEAIAFYEKTISLNPQHLEAQQNLGNLFAVNGNFAAAISCYQEVLKLNPQSASLHNNLGNCFLAINQITEAISAYEKAISLNPNYPEAIYNLGNAWRLKGDLAAAKKYYEKTISWQPNFTEAHNNLGLVLQEEGCLTAAIDCYQQAIALNPNYPKALNNLGNAFAEQKELEKALSYYQKALDLNPEYIEAYNNLGNVLLTQGKMEEAISYYDKALNLNPLYIDAHYNYANALKFQQKLSEAIARYEYILTLNPQFAEAHKNLGIALLLTGELSRGFAEFEWRWQTKEYQKHSALQPIWDSSNLKDKRILLFCEQGFGDNIQFIRYATIMAEKGAQITVACYPKLVRLFSSISGVEKIVTSGTTVECDQCVPMMSLPHLLGTNSQTIPTEIPYLSPPQPYPFILETPPGTFLKVGIVWAGNPEHKNDHNRSTSLTHFLPLFNLTGIAFYSLQKGSRVKDLRELNLLEKVQDLSDKITDFADTAAAISQLDLVISVDTSVVHLAGALGKPT